jgi:hypothetical protein
VDEPTRRAVAGRRLPGGDQAVSAVLPDPHLPRLGVLGALHVRLLLRHPAAREILLLAVFWVLFWPLRMRQKKKNPEEYEEYRKKYWK